MRSLLHCKAARAPCGWALGGGIVGGSIALHMAQAGASVTLFDKAQPASGATHDSLPGRTSSWLTLVYRALRLQSLMAYHALDRRLKLGIIWGGYINWASSVRSAFRIARRGACALPA